MSRLMSGFDLLKLLPQYRDKSALQKITRNAGRFLGIDTDKQWVTKGIFARVCVSIDANKPLVPGAEMGEKR